jgi:catechol 2,3-dioxygenase-like lactoylglutathione lyase family enzyme
MPMGALQHVNIRCADADRSRDFYVEVLGLTQGDRPPFASSGYWLYFGGVPIVHLVQKVAGEPKRGPGTGEIDHIAFEGSDLPAMRESLNSRGIAFREALVPRDQVVQVFVHDPDGIQIELNFPE